jgi:hypothetical protein
MPTTGRKTRTFSPAPQNVVITIDNVEINLGKFVNGVTLKSKIDSSLVVELTYNGFMVPNSVDYEICEKDGAVKIYFKSSNASILRGLSSYLSLGEIALGKYGMKPMSEHGFETIFKHPINVQTPGDDTEIRENSRRDPWT